VATFKSNIDYNIKNIHMKQDLIEIKELLCLISRAIHNIFFFMLSHGFV